MSSLLGLLVWTVSVSANPDLRATAIDQVIRKVHERKLSSDENTPWVIMHGVIAFEKDLSVFDTEKKESVNAVEFLLNRATFKGERIFREKDGIPTLPIRPGGKHFLVQDHVDQVLMSLADAHIGLDRELTADTGKAFKVSDLLNAAKGHFLENQELGWTLVAMCTYLTFKDSWTANSGTSYQIEDVLRLAIQRDPRRETEGGPHHLYGVAFALEKYRAEGGKIEGVWKEAEAYLDKYIGLAKAWQNEDGAFSGQVFYRKAPAGSPKRLVSVTGHFLEWMSIALTTAELEEKWVLRAVDRLTGVLLKYPLETFSDGGMYHAAHALRRYRDRVGGGKE